MVGEGADILSDAFARVFNGHAVGEDMSALFHANIWEYRDSIDFTTNCWITVYSPDLFWTPALYHDQARVVELTKEQDVYLADCNHWRLYTPEYKFTLLEQDGSETLLQDYGVDNLYACAPGALSGKTLRLYARIVDHEDNGEVFYDLSIE